MRCLFAAILLCAAVAVADGPSDNLPDKVRPIPPKGIVIDEKDRAELRAGLRELADAIAKLGRTLPPARQPLLADVEIFHKAIEYALTLDQFNKSPEVAFARKLLQEGMGRAKALSGGTAPWTTATGLVVRGFRSRIDGSVQPYGLVVPRSYRGDGGRLHRLDIWLHGRQENLSELAFLDERLRSPGQFTPADAFVLHPSGRYCNAFKFAGEIDVLEAQAHVAQNYRIDSERVVLRGFSMGGAGCWHLAVHYPDRWVAAAPGAGFSETPDFLRVFQDEKVDPPAYERALWQLYDCPGYAANLFNLPTVAYSGEKDRQKQAADVMAAALQREGMSLLHLIGPGTAHSYHPASRAEIDRRIDRIAAAGRPRAPERVRFATYTLRYNRSYWVMLDRLGKHWEQARIQASLPSGLDVTTVRTSNVEAFTLALGPGAAPLRLAGTPRVVIDGQAVTAAPVLSDRSWTTHFRRRDGKWTTVPSTEESSLVKRHGLQGPIDDAFMDSFLIVRPTGKAAGAVGAWVDAEMKRAIREWKRHFRGEPRVKDDTAVTADDIARHHLLLWGTPESNALLKKMRAELPFRWSPDTVEIGKVGHDAGRHVPVLIYPNPLNAQRYVVINSGFTYREYDYLNNARQVPKLPDYAVLDVTTTPSARHPGKVVVAGFFDEQWRLPE